MKDVSSVCCCSSVAAQLSICTAQRMWAHVVSTTFQCGLIDRALNVPLMSLHPHLETPTDA